MYYYPSAFWPFQDLAWSHIGNCWLKNDCTFIVFRKMDSYSSKGNYWTIFPSYKFWIARTWKSRECKDKAVWLSGKDTSGQALALILLLKDTLPEALHFPFLPYIDHCVARPIVNTAHTQIDFMENDRLFMYTLLCGNRKRPYFLKRLWFVFTLKEMYKGDIYLTYFTNIRQSITVLSSVPWVNAMAQLFHQQLAFINCIYTQRTLVN